MFLCRVNGRSRSRCVCHRICHFPLWPGRHPRRSSSTRPSAIGKESPGKFIDAAPALPFDFFFSGRLRGTPGRDPFRRLGGCAPPFHHRPPETHPVPAPVAFASGNVSPGPVNSPVTEMATGALRSKIFCPAARVAAQNIRRRNAGNREAYPYSRRRPPTSWMYLLSPFHSFRPLSLERRAFRGLGGEPSTIAYPLRHSDRSRPTCERRKKGWAPKESPPPEIGTVQP